MREEKQLLLDEIDEKIEASSGFIVASYSKMNAVKMRKFRDELSETASEFEIVRKRVFVKAVEKHGIKIPLDALDGHIGIVFVKEEITAPAKFVVNFGQQNGNAIAVLSGLIEGELVSAEEIKAIATLPSLNELRALFVGLIQAPMAQLLTVVNEILVSVPRCIEQKSNKS